MKILIQGYNTCHQNIAGGVARRIDCFINALKNNGVECKVFDYWNDNIEDFDLVHFFKIQPEHYGLANYLRHKNKPYVLSTIVPIEKKSWIKVNVFFNKLKIHTLIGMNKVLLDNASLILTQSKQEKKFVESSYSLNVRKVHCLPNGVILSKTNFDEKAFLDKYSVNNGFVLCVGRIDPNKNQLNLIRALNNSNMQLVIVGGPDPQYMDYFERCKKEAASNIIFTGWLTLDDMLLKSAYCCAKAVVVPSFRETFGNVLLEGGINHANLAYSENLAINDWGLGEYAYLFDPKHIADIRQVIERAYNASINEELYTFIQEHFTWDAVAKKHINLYKQIL